MSNRVSPAKGIIIKGDIISMLFTASHVPSDIFDRT